MVLLHEEKLKWKQKEMQNTESTYLSEPHEVYVAESVKTQHNHTLFKFQFIKCLWFTKPSVCSGKFQPDMPITLGVIALTSGNSKKIDFYSKHWENKLQALTKMDVTYKWNVTQL